MGRGKEGREGNRLRTELMSVRHGFVSPALGRRTRSFGSGGRRIGVSFVGAPLGGIVAASSSFSCKESQLTSGGRRELLEFVDFWWLEVKVKVKVELKD